jgi:hypothetical protein
MIWLVKGMCFLVSNLSSPAALRGDVRVVAQPFRSDLHATGQETDWKPVVLCFSTIAMKLECASNPRLGVNISDRAPCYQPK